MLADCVYYATPQGWILVLGHPSSSEARLLNPTTGAEVSLPPLEEEGLGWPYHLNVRRAAARNAGAPPLVVPRRRRRWVKHRYDIGKTELPPGMYASATADRIIETVAAVGASGAPSTSSASPTTNHAPSCCLLRTPRRQARRRRLNSSRSTRRTRDPQNPPSMSISWSLESGGELYLVTVRFSNGQIGEVAVFRMDFATAEGSGNMASSCPASACSGEGDRVYFLKNPVKDDGELCVYDVRRRKLDAMKVFDVDGTPPLCQRRKLTLSHAQKRFRWNAIPKP
uniref:DUF295 domain-containing protein n=1 Tax=Oryza punctata TaxID=4537 RepID=A0A0E0K020_ORYPU